MITIKEKKMSDDNKKLTIDDLNSILTEKDSNILKALLSSKNKPDKRDLSRKEKIETLEERYSAFIKHNDFKSGELVKWKPGLRNKNGFKDDDAAIVIEALKNPIFDQKHDSGSPYFKEPLDMLIAFLDPDNNNFIILYVDSRRMEHAKK